MQARQEQVEKL